MDRSSVKNFWAPAAAAGKDAEAAADAADTAFVTDPAILNRVFFFLFKKNSECFCLKKNMPLC